jgi:hypothetical protein
MLGRGHGAETMRPALERYFASPEVTGVLIDPLRGNEGAIRLYRRLGFVDATIPTQSCFVCIATSGNAAAPTALAEGKSQRGTDRRRACNGHLARTLRAQDHRFLDSRLTDGEHGIGLEKRDLTELQIERRTSAGRRALARLA